MFLYVCPVLTPVEGKWMFFHNILLRVYVNCIVLERIFLVYLHTYCHTFNYIYMYSAIIVSVVSVTFPL
jgi:hypothetical protein